jgi:hypothetical protein
MTAIERAEKQLEKSIRTCERVADVVAKADDHVRETNDFLAALRARTREAARRNGRPHVRGK